MNIRDFLQKLQEETKNTNLITNASDMGLKLSQDYITQEVVLPQNIDELATIIRLANKYGVPIYPVGSGTRFTQGISPFDKGILVSLKNIANLVEYRPNNMSIEIEAGMTIGEIQKVLAQDNIFFPIDSNENSTVGGLIATNAFGRKKYLYKPVRFSVMGMEFISPQGEIINVGGRTLKNVSSYDLHQLLAGSWGALGIITKATLKVKPIPEKTLVLHYQAKDTNDLLNIIETILFKEKLNMAALTFEQSKIGHLIQLELEGFAETLELQKEILQNKYGFKESNDLKATEYNENAIIALTLKSYVSGLKQLLELQQKYPDLKVRGNATSGLLYLELKEEKNLVESIQELIHTLEGNFVYKNQSLAKKDRGVGYQALLKNIKNTIDPKNILAPSSRVIKE